MDQSFPSDVESEANSYFQKIYNQPPNPTMTIDEVLEMLKKFKDSPSKKEKVTKSTVTDLFQPSAYSDYVKVLKKNMKEKAVDQTFVTGRINKQKNIS